MLCGSLDRQRAEVLGRMITYLSMAESRCLSTWNYHNVLISYTPIQNKKLKKIPSNWLPLDWTQLFHGLQPASMQSTLNFLILSVCIYIKYMYMCVSIHADTHTHASCWFCFSKEMFVMKDTILTIVAVELRLLKTKHRISLCEWMDCNTGWTSTLTGYLLKEVRS